MDTFWLILIYRIPSEPSARRVYVWRKLKRLGAMMQHDAAWVLPATPHTREQFQWLAAEIIEADGEAVVWEARQVFSTAPEALRDQFLAQVETEYQEMLVALQGDAPDLAAISRRYQQIQSQDYFQSPLGLEVRAALLRAREGGRQ